MRHEVGAIAVEAELEQRAEHLAADDGEQHGERGVPLAVEEQVADHRQRHHHQDAEAAERGEVAQHLLHPGWPERRAVGAAECEQDPAVELRDLAFEDFVRDLDERPDRRGAERERGENRPSHAGFQRG
jgi:hypothetical protein